MTYDVIIIGAGLVGASVAAALADTPLRLAIVEREPPRDGGGEWDSRIYAISPASRGFLESVGAWQGLDPARIQPVRRMEIRGDRDAQLAFSAYETGVAALAYIVESRAMQQRFWRGLESQENLDVVCPARCAALAREEGGWRLVLEDGRRLVGKLVVGADGTRSWVRETAGLKAKMSPYGHQGVVANFACERPHDGAASQWFRADGVLAYLPLPGDRMSMVWSTPDAHAAELLALSPAALCDQVASAGQGRLGKLSLVTAPAAFPLALMQVERLAVAGLALVGDAAHVVHPLAGQGVNLGFADARVLAALIREREVFREPGDPTLMRRYERARAEDILAMRVVTHGLQRLFSLPGRIPATMRNLGLNLTDDLAVLKGLLVRHALG